MRQSLAARAIALAAACAVTGLVFFVHAADLSTLGARPLLVDAGATSAPAAASPVAMMAANAAARTATR